MNLPDYKQGTIQPRKLFYNDLHKRSGMLFWRNNRCKNAIIDGWSNSRKWGLKIISEANRLFIRIIVILIIFKYLTMRTLIAMVLMALFAQGAVAQIERGTFRIGPTFEFATNSDDESDFKSSQFVLGADASYFVIPNLGVGLDVLAGFFNYETDGDKSTSTTIGIGPQAVYMVGLSEQFYLPIYARYLFISNNSDDDFFGDMKGTGTLLGFGTGIEYLVAKKLGLRLNVGYEITTMEYEDSPAFNSEDKGIRSSLGIGVYF